MKSLKMPMILPALVLLAAMPVFFGAEARASSQIGVHPVPGAYRIVDTNQKKLYDNTTTVNAISRDSVFYGQDGNYAGNAPSYRNNGNGTVTDQITGLMWQQDPGEKKTYSAAVAGAKSCRIGGYDDWRLPTIKELYSLIEFSGEDPSGVRGTDTSGMIPFIDRGCFKFQYGDSRKERIIDSQYVSSTKYVSTTMNGNETVFGVNFADGRIKGYPISTPQNVKTFYTMYVRGNPDYGVNDFHDNGDGTITDNATGLMWMQSDNGTGGLTRADALKWAESSKFAGHEDWRLPNAKEMQSIVDYQRAPAITHSPAINPIFKCTAIKNEKGITDYPYYWTGTTHASAISGGSAVYFSFGEALGWMKSPAGTYSLLDVHGAGAQRSDPKAGNPGNYPYGHGPQGDVIRIYNYVRLVRDIH